MTTRLPSELLLLAAVLVLLNVLGLALAARDRGGRHQATAETRRRPHVHRIRLRGLR